MHQDFDLSTPQGLQTSGVAPLGAAPGASCVAIRLRLGRQLMIPVEVDDDAWHAAKLHPFGVHQGQSPGREEGQSPIL